MRFGEVAGRLPHVHFYTTTGEGTTQGRLPLGDPEWRLESRELSRNRFGQGFIWKQNRSVVARDLLGKGIVIV